MEIVYRSELSVGVFGKVVRPDPHVRTQVGMVIVDTAVKNRDDDLAAALCDEPRFQRIDVSTLLSAVLAEIIQSPLIA